MGHTANINLKGKMMERNELANITDKAESRQNILNMALRHLHACCTKAVEDYKDEHHMFIGMVEGALENVDKDLGDLK